MTIARISPPKLSMAHLLGIAVLISAGCLIGLYIFLRRQPLPPTLPSAGEVVQLRLVPTAPAVVSEAPRQGPDDKAPQKDADAVVHSSPRRSVEVPPAAADAGQGGQWSGMSLAAPPSSMATSVAADDAVLDFQRRLLFHIGRYRRYPPAARRAHLAGNVLVIFTMSRDGSVRQASIENSSGSAIFDQEALDTVRRAEPLPPIPSGLSDQLKILLPVEFGAP